MGKMKEGAKVTGGEKASYGLYFLGQNIFYMLIFMFLNTYFTDVGISAAAVGVIALIVKVWDAVNDPIFGGLMDKVKFKKGKFVPWLKISLIAIPLATIFLFAIPTSIGPAGKIAWAVVGYMLWDTAYTICDVPIFGLVTTMTDVQNERTGLNAIGRVCAMIAAMAVMIVIPTFRGMMGGWTSTVVMLSVVAFITMVPICFKAKERCVNEQTAGDADVSLKDMFSYLKTNKYLVIYYAAFMVSGGLAVGSVWGLYIARHCLGDESLQSIVSILGFAPIIIIGMFVPAMTRKIDKFKLFYIAIIASLVANIAKFFVGYSSIPAFIAMSVVAALPGGVTSVLMYMFTPDCAEYGFYKTGKSMPGITFATQTFFAKFQSAVVTAIGSFALAAIGFVEGENAVQAADFGSRLWFWSCILPIIGIALQLIILRAYKLNDHDVQLMAQANMGEITREEAEAQMINKY